MTGLDDALRLAEALCARICHDLSSSLTVIGGSLDLLQADEQLREEAQDLALEATAAMQHRVRFIRAAWAGGGDTLSIQEALALAEGLPGAPRVTLNLDSLPPSTVFPSHAGRALLGLMFMAAESLPAGGQITIIGTPNDMVMLVDGPRAAWPAHLAECLADDAAILAAIDQPRTVAMPLAILFARATGMEVSILLSSGSQAGPPPLRIRDSRIGPANSAD